MDNEFNLDQAKSAQLSSSSSQLTDRLFVPKYAGRANAFAIQLFCIEEKYDSRFSIIKKRINKII